MPLSREELVQIADKVIALRGRKVGQVQIAQQLQVSQPQVCLLASIVEKCCPEALEAWQNDDITTEVASDLARLSHPQQKELLDARPEDNQTDWNLLVARESGRKKRPLTRELRDLIQFLENAEDLDAKKVEGAISALRHSAGDLSREDLLEMLR